MSKKETHMAVISHGQLDTSFDLPRVPVVRCEYLRTLWEADINAQIFIDIVHCLGYVLSAQWDGEAGMPVLARRRPLTHSAPARDRGQTEQSWVTYVQN
ncbi:hypothetical protein KPG66_13925 [Mycetohabitans sp. B2]|uniref:Transposase n=2 Tax=Burkholderiaceae TaxID=119060 RepID=A0ABZ2Q0K8_9BURK|nr:hypothetical protein [Mycetohabitans sp. B2]